jgi:hypothetical protein
MFMWTTVDTFWLSRTTSCPRSTVSCPCFTVSWLCAMTSRLDDQSSVPSASDKRIAVATRKPVYLS